MTLEEYGRECYWEGYEEGQEIVMQIFAGKTPEEIAVSLDQPLERFEEIYRKTMAIIQNELNSGPPETRIISDPEYKGETQ